MSTPIENNTEGLLEILQTVNNLPEAGSGGAVELPDAEDAYFGTDIESGGLENAILSGGSMTQSSSTNTRYGLRFTPAEAFEIRAIRVWISNWTKPSRKVVLHDSDGNVLFSVEDGNGAGGWNQIDLETPIVVSPNKTYTLYQNTYYYSGYNYDFSGTVFNSKLGTVVGATGANNNTGTPTDTTLYCGSVDFVIAPMAAPAPEEYKVQRSTMDSIANEVKRITGASTVLKPNEIITALQGIASTA